MDNCRICAGILSNRDDGLCKHCQDMESEAQRLIRSNPERARKFFRDLVILAGQRLRAEAAGRLHV